ncbi:MAG TPA: copper amine oxidase N-terminal domain-containing protein [Fimbriimonadaceae bacterium]|nr:copper amine oxidase N-terminal domain-containing protein [Fimbriimonadaceae bacterium]
MRTLVATRMIFVAMVGLLFGSARAGFIDGTVLINRAANNKTITVKYDGVRVALVELRVNGESVSSRSIDGATSTGETNFALNPAILADGNNSIEVRLFDAQGKLVGRQESTVFVDRKPTGPVYLAKPNAGSTVNGPVEITLGLHEKLSNLYVSFFVDDDFQSLRNYPPYTYVWDTSGVSNGWHEVQAWVVDVNDSSRTYKTEKMRLFVNNPSGHTERMNPLDTTTTASAKTAAKTAELKTTDAGTTTAPVVSAIKPTLTAPTVSVNTDEMATAAPAGTKAPRLGKGAITGQRTLLPTGTRVAVEASVVPKADSKQPGEPAKLALRTIKFGTRLDSSVNFAVELNGHVLDFDAPTRVVDGVPFAPFRHIFEEAGGTVNWKSETKTVEADGLGGAIKFSIGNDYGTLNGSKFLFERAPYIESGRTIVPLSFVSSTLNIDVQYDPNTEHVLITSTNRR